MIFCITVCNYKHDKHNSLSSAIKRRFLFIPTDEPVPNHIFSYSWNGQGSTLYSNETSTKSRTKGSTVPIERRHVRSGKRITVPYKKLDSVWTQPLHFLPKTLLKPSVSFAYACLWLFVEFNFNRKLMFILSCYIEEPKGNSSGYLSSVLNWTTYWL